MTADSQDTSGPPTEAVADRAHGDVPVSPPPLPFGDTHNGETHPLNGTVPYFRTSPFPAATFDEAVEGPLPERSSGVPAVTAAFVLIVGLAFVLAGAAVSYFLTGAGGSSLVNEQRAVPLGGAGTASVNLGMGVGKLAVAGGAEAGNLMDAKFTYNEPSWKPTVVYEVSAGAGALTVSQPSGKSTSNNSKYEWNVKLDARTPKTLLLTMGAGDLDLRLGGLNLSSARITSGTGKSTVDLTGQWQQAATVEIHSGSGEIRLLVPSSVPAKVTAAGSPALRVEANGFTRSGNTYTNKAYGKAGPGLTVNVLGGAGTVTIEQAR